MHVRGTSDYYFIKDDIIKGDWFIDEKGILTITMNWSEDVGRLRTKIENYTSSGEYKFLSYSEDYIKYELTTPGYEPEQANRIK